MADQITTTDNFGQSKQTEETTSLRQKRADEAKELNTPKPDETPEEREEREAKARALNDAQETTQIPETWTDDAGKPSEG